MRKVSVIVPVYNVEKYLKRCVESILSQTMKNLEIILVDDGSTDQSGIICDEYAKKDSRIKVVHKKNGGLSSARNAGLAIAQGKYVGFVDSDDDIENIMYERMYETIEKENVDFVMSDYIRIPGNGETYLKTLEIEKGRYDRNNIREKIFPQLIMSGNLEYGPLLSVWHCMYRTDFLRKYNLKFDEEVRWSEDNIFSAFVGYYASSFYYLKGEGLYHYYNNPGTITTSYRSGAWNVYCTMNHHLHQFFDKVEDYDFQRQLKLHMIFYACNCLGQIKASGETFRKQVNMRKDIMNSLCLKEAFQDFAFPDWSWKLKLQILLIKYCKPCIYSLVV